MGSHGVRGRISRSLLFLIAGKSISHSKQMVAIVTYMVAFSAALINREIFDAIFVENNTANIAVVVAASVDVRLPTNAGERSVDNPLINFDSNVVD